MEGRLELVVTVVEMYMQSISFLKKLILANLLYRDFYPNVKLNKE